MNSETSKIISKLPFSSQILEEEENDNVVYAIREEIMQKVMSEIDMIGSKQKLVEFVVDCAHSALVQFISLQFYHHNSPPDMTNEWLEDEPDEPSPPDSWACRNLPIRYKSTSESQTEFSSDSTKTCCCEFQYGKCRCLDPQSEILEHLKDRSYASFRETAVDLSDKPESGLVDVIEVSADAEKSGDPSEENALDRETSDISSTDWIHVGASLKTSILKKHIVPAEVASEVTSQTKIPPKINQLSPFRDRGTVDASTECNDFKKKEHS